MKLHLLRRRTARGLTLLAPRAATPTSCRSGSRSCLLTMPMALRTTRMTLCHSIRPNGQITRDVARPPLTRPSPTWLRRRRGSFFTARTQEQTLSSQRSKSTRTRKTLVRTMVLSYRRESARSSIFRKEKTTTRGFTARMLCSLSLDPRLHSLGSPVRELSWTTRSSHSRRMVKRIMNFCDRFGLFCYSGKTRLFSHV